MLCMYMYLRQYHVAHGLSLSVKVLNVLIAYKMPNRFSHMVIFTWLVQIYKTNQVQDKGQLKVYQPKLQDYVSVCLNNKNGFNRGAAAAVCRQLGLLNLNQKPYTMTILGHQIFMNTELKK